MAKPERLSNSATPVLTLPWLLLESCNPLKRHGYYVKMELEKRDAQLLRLTVLGVTLGAVYTLALAAWLLLPAVRPW